MTTIITQYELKQLRQIACEAVRRGVGYDDWIAEVVPRLLDRGEDQPAATNIAANIWHAACKTEKLQL